MMTPGPSRNGSLAIGPSSLGSPPMGAGSAKLHRRGLDDARDLELPGRSARRKTEPPPAPPAAPETVARDRRGRSDQASIPTASART